MANSSTELPSEFELRQERYDALFAGELPYEPLPPEMEVGVSGLARITRRGGARSAQTREYLEQVPEIIDNILKEHDIEAHDPDSLNAIFSFVDSSEASALESRQLVGSVVAKIFVQWEVTHTKRGLDRLLCSEGGRWLVLETACAVMDTATSYNELNLENKVEAQLVTTMLASWGPRFVSQWLDGSVLRQWAEHNDLSSTEIDELRELFSPAALRAFMEGNPMDPLGGLEKVKHHLDVTLTDENMAEALGWSIDEIQQTFPPSRRLYLATNYVGDPLRAARKASENLESVLTDENIASYLGWEVDEVAATFTTAIRRRFALSNLNNPLRALKRVKDNFDLLTDANIAKHVGCSAEEISAIFTPGIKKHLAMSSLKDSLGTAGRIVRGLADTYSYEHIAAYTGWDMGTVEEVFTPSIRVRLAYHYSRDPQVGLEKVVRNLALLTDGAIADYLEWSTEKVALVFTPNARKKFATGWASDPLKACKDWVEGKISLTDNSDHAMVLKLRNDV